MSRDSEPTVAPLKRMDGEPVFDEPWQAEVLAMADALVASGTIRPQDWSEALGAALKDAADEGAADNAVTYYQAALEAFEQVVEAQAGISRQAVAEMRDAWAAAYRATPHGRPVQLERPLK